MSVVEEILLLLGIALFVLWWMRQSNKNKQFYNTIPGPPTLPILGNALDFMSTAKLIPNLEKHTKEYGEIIKVQIGPIQDFIVVSDYKFLEFILSSTKVLHKSDNYKFIRPWLGRGLLTSYGPKWKKHRRILTPAFHFQILEQFINVFESCGKQLVQKFHEEMDKDSVDVYPYVTLCTLDIICESIMGTGINAQENSESDYVCSVKDMGRIIIERTLSPIQMYDFLFPLTRNYYTQRKALTILHAQTNQVITKRRQELQHEKIDIKEQKNFETKTKKVFLDLLLEATIDGRLLTQEEIREEVDTFMFEGHDTTASAISFALFCLANHPHVQEKAFEEQKSIFDDNKDPTVTLADLQSMKYLEQVIKETLRLYPSVPLYGREITDAVDYGNLTLPQGGTIIVFAYGIQRNPKYFKNPDQFIPSRFDEIDGKLPYAFIPFSAGPRNCIGQKFAMLEMKSTISRVLRSFELLPSIPKHDLELLAEAILKSANGIKIRFKRR